MSIDSLNQAFQNVDKNPTDNTTDVQDPPENSEEVKPKNESLESLSDIDFSQIKNDRRESQESIGQILQRDRTTRKGSFVPSPEEYRNYEDWFGNTVTEHESGGGDALSAEQTDPRFQDLRKMRAQAQGPLAEGVNALKAVPKMGLGIIEQAGYLLDFTRYDDILKAGSKLAQGEEVEGELDVTNPLSESMRDAGKWFEKMMPIYRENPNAIWDMTDTAWYFQNGSMLAETMGEFAATGYGIGKGVGLLAKGAKAGVSAGARVNTVRGGAKVARGIDTASDLASASLLGHAEGSMVGMQTYDQTYRQVKQKLQESDKDLTQAQIERRAKVAASQSAATATAVNSVVFPFLNYTSAKLLSSATKSSPTAVSSQLRKQIDDAVDGTDVAPTTKNLKALKSNIDDFDAAPKAGGLKQEALETGKESFRESVEELGAVVAEEEGREVGLSKEGMGTERTVGERLSDALFTPQAALEATLGAIGGAGQYGIMSNIATIDAGDGEGRITQREAKRRAEQQQINKEKKIIKNRVDQLVEAKKLLNEAEKTDNEQEAQELRSRGMRKLKVANSSSSVARGVSHQLKRFYKGIRNLDENEAENEGLDTDPDSDTYYKNLADEQIRDIEEYEEKYENLKDQYNFGAQEELAGIPELLLQLQIEQDQSKKSIERMEGEKEKVIDYISEQFGEYSDAVVENKTLEAKEKAITDKNESLFKLIEQLDYVDSKLAEEMSLEEYVQQSNSQASNEISNTLSEFNKRELQEIFDNTRDLNVNQAIELLNALASKRESELAEVKEDKLDNPYRDWLDRRNLEDNESNKRAYQHEIARYENSQRAEQVENIESAIQTEKTALETAREKFDAISTADGRQQMVDKAKETFEGKRKRLLDQYKRAINNRVNSLQDLNELEQEIKDLGLDELQDYIQEKREQLETQKRRNKDDSQREEIDDIKNKYDKRGAKEKIQEEVDKEKEAYVDTASEISKQDQETEDTTADDEVSEEERSSLMDTIREGAGTVRDAVTEDGPEGPEQGPQQASTTYEKLEDTVNRYVDNTHFKISEAEANPEESLEDFVDDLREGFMEGRSEDEVDINWEGLKNQAKRRYNKRRNQAREDETKASEVENQTSPTTKDKPPENPTDEPSQVSDQAESSIKNPEVGSSITYFTQEYVEIDGIKYNETNERSERLDYPLIEHWDHVNKGDNIQLAVLNERFDDNRKHTTASDLNDLDNFGEEHIDTAVIGIYYTEGGRDKFLGYLRRPTEDSINQNSTYKDNVEEERATNRRIRKKILDAYMNGYDRVDAQVGSKTPGQLTKNWKKNEDGTIDQEAREVVPQTVNEGFPDQEVEYYVIRGQNIDNGETTDDVNKGNLENRQEFFGDNEGSAGLLVKMGNGNKMAVPVWLPKFNEIDGEPISETIFNIAERVESGDTSLDDGRIDLSDPKVVKSLIEDYGYVTTRGQYEILNDDSSTGIEIVVGQDSGNVHIVNNTQERVYTTDENLAANNEDTDLISENRTEVLNSIAQMRFNVDVDKINIDTQNGRRLTTNDEGNLEVVRYDTYNDFISDFVRTDLDASYSITNPDTGQSDHLVYQHPTPRIDEQSLTVDGGENNTSTATDTPPPSNPGENAGTRGESENTEDSTIDSVKENAFNVLETQIQNSTVGISSSGVSDPVATHIRSDGVKFKINNQLSNILKNNDINVEEFLREFSDKVNVNYDVASEFLDFNFTVEVGGKDGKIEITTQENIQSDIEESTTEEIDVDQRAVEIADTIRENDQYESVDDYIEDQQEEVEVETEEDVSSEKGEILNEIEYIRENNPFALRSVENFNNESDIEAEEVTIESNAADFQITEDAESPTRVWRFNISGTELFIPAPKRTGGFTHVANEIAPFITELEQTVPLTREEIDSGTQQIDQETETELQDTVESSTAKDLRDQIESVLEQREKQSIEDRFNELSPSNNLSESTEKLQNIKSDLQSLKASVEEGSELHQEIQDEIDRIGPELSGRDGVNNTPDTGEKPNDNSGDSEEDIDVGDDVFEDIDDDLSLDQKPRTPTEDISKDETSDSDKTVEEVAEENNDINCKV